MFNLLECFKIYMVSLKNYWTKEGRDLSRYRTKTETATNEVIWKIAKNNMSLRPTEVMVKLQDICGC